MGLPEGDHLALRPIGDHIREGMEVELQYNKSWFHKLQKKQWNMSHTLHFNTWQHLVTKAYAGNDNLPVSGFRDVYHIFAEGYPMDAIGEHSGSATL